MGCGDDEARVWLLWPLPVQSAEEACAVLTTSTDVVTQVTLSL